MTDRVLIVGESNPYGADPHFALYPHPVGCAGWRLCEVVLGLGRKDYLARYARANLLDGPLWVPAAARASAERLLPGRSRLVLLGARVARAFRVDPEPFRVATLPGGARAAIIPHPSGRCRTWNEPGAYERARATVRALEAAP